jgi:hypothetical protein
MLETVTVELDAQQDTLSSAVEHIDLTNTKLHNRIDRTINTSNRRRPQGDNPNDCKDQWPKRRVNWAFFLFLKL